MRLHHPVDFYKLGRFWIGALFIWVAIVGFPHTLVTAGDVFAYGLIFIVAVAAVVSSFFESNRQPKS
ncbi:hypothetical protein [Lactiplantibacillus fabifermentans]|nr:hypothetical protein [Lactiplantibacillus fabifermentans]ETY74296.1 hypothetical protein LFAB_07445 [Lactiplantibacillus fabifermentans T30PCM01]